MAEVKVYHKLVNVDIMELLEDFTWVRPRWTEDKLIAASPFRYDSTPSFFVNLTGDYAGTWGDSGAYDPEWESGNLPKLLAFLRNETYEEACEYLLKRFGYHEKFAGNEIELPPVEISTKTRHITLTEEELAEYQFRHPYLERQRGIPEKVQRFFGVGYSKADKAIVIPWRYPNGSLANYKFRKVRGKAFWYRRNGAPIRSLVFGIDKVYKYGLKEVVVSEAEIDAMSWWSARTPAIALGSASLSDKQVDIIRKSPIETLIISTDNDAAGRKIKRQLTEAMAGYVRLKTKEIPEGYKDANEAHVSGERLENVSEELIGLNFDNLLDRYVKV